MSKQSPLLFTKAVSPVYAAASDENEGVVPPPVPPPGTTPPVPGTAAALNAEARTQVTELVHLTGVIMASPEELQDQIGKEEVAIVFHYTLMEPFSFQWFRKGQREVTKLTPWICAQVNAGLASLVE